MLAIVEAAILPYRWYVGEAYPRTLHPEFVVGKAEVARCAKKGAGPLGSCYKFGGFSQGRLGLL